MRIREDTFRQAVMVHLAGRWQEAGTLYESLLRDEPRHAGAWHLLGVVAYQQGRSEDSVDHIRRAIALDGLKAPYYNNLGIALKALGKLDEAVEAYRSALAIRPDYADALSNLAVLLHKDGEFDTARDLFMRALTIQPNHADALFNLGNLSQDQGLGVEAVEAYRKSLAIQPNRADGCNNLGNALVAQRRLPEAITAYRQAISLCPDHPQAHANLGNAYTQEGRIEEAVECYRRASELQPAQEVTSLRSLGLCPVIFPSVEALQDYRRQFEVRLDAMAAEPVEMDWRRFPHECAVPSFRLAHHGCNNRRLLGKLATVFQRHFPQPSPVGRHARPRIGFLATCGHEGGFIRGMSGIVQGLDRSRFDVAVLCSHSALAACRRGIPGGEINWVALPGRFEAAVEAATAAECDLIYHWQVGTDPANYFLPFARPAPIQCTSWGSHGTTGIPAMDYYLSSSLIEAEVAEDHFSERLVRMATLPTYQYRPPRAEGASRAALGLPEQGHLYLCPQRLAKFHPEADELLAEVLRRDPQGLLVLLQGSSPHVLADLQKRFDRTLGGLRERLIVLPSQGHADFLRLLSLADAVLDPLHYSSGLTAYDAFSQAAPIVTLPDEFSVGRYASACYRKMGLDTLIAADPEQYASMAVRLGTDRAYRESVKAAILQRSDRLFDDPEAVREHERFFERALTVSGA